MNEMPYIVVDRMSGVKLGRFQSKIHARRFADTCPSTCDIEDAEVSQTPQNGEQWVITKAPNMYSALVPFFANVRHGELVFKVADELQEYAPNGVDTLPVNVFVEYGDWDGHQV